jgi:transcriptional regulator with XRE-family HTH domain
MGDFGQILRARRKEKGLTQIALSQLLERNGIFFHNTVISRWETGASPLSTKDRDNVIAIADVLGMTEDEKNALLLSAGLAPLRSNELDVDKMLKGLGPERRYHTYFLHKVLGWDERQIGDKLGIPFYDVQRDIERVEEEKRIEGRFIDEKEIKERTFDIEMHPGSGKYHNVDLESDTILIDRITVRPSDIGAPFDFLVFDREQHSEYQTDEDLVWKGSSKGPRLSWLPVRPELYRDRDGTQRLHLAIAVHERLTRFDLEQQELDAYLKRPVTFTVVVRYQPIP